MSQVSVAIYFHPPPQSQKIKIKMLLGNATWIDEILSLFCVIMIVLIGALHSKTGRRLRLPLLLFIVISIIITSRLVGSYF